MFLFLNYVSCRNGIQSKTGTIIGRYIEYNQRLRRLNLEYNELGTKGIECFADVKLP